MPGVRNFAVWEGGATVTIGRPKPGYDGNDASDPIQIKRVPSTMFPPMFLALPKAVCGVALRNVWRIIDEKQGQLPLPIRLPTVRIPLEAKP